ncbi:MAG: DUF1080 domain-containing protein [Planctomycetaceae bacterium]
MPARITRRKFLLSSTATCLTSQLASGLFAAAARDNDWIELFDGRTLKGWHRNPAKIGHGTGGRWRAEDGSITGEQDPPGSGNGGILLTDRKFGNFELLIDMKPDWGVCSGLFLRSNDKGQCLQMMVDYHDAGNVGHLYGEGTGGFNTRTFDINGLYGKDTDKSLVGITTDKHRTAEEVGLISTCTPDEWVKAWKIDDWNTAKVRIAGDDPGITTWINKQKVCEFDGAGTSNVKYRQDRQKILDTIGTEGSIAVQVHGGTGWPKGAKCRWKNIRIKSL